MFSYIFSFTSLNTVFGEGAGGSYGFYLNEWLVNMVGPVAAGCLIGFLLLIWAILLNNKVVGFITRIFNSIFEKKSHVSVDNQDDNGGENDDGADGCKDQHKDKAQLLSQKQNQR
jgi:hypothetical protein